MGKLLTNGFNIPLDNLEGAIKILAEKRAKQRLAQSNADLYQPVSARFFGVWDRKQNKLWEDCLEIAGDIATVYDLDPQLDEAGEDALSYLEGKYKL